MSESIEAQEALARADKDAWREREGWCTPEEVELTLSGQDGAHFEFIESD
jgi:hypothetical protein